MTFFMYFLNSESSSNCSVSIATMNCSAFLTWKQTAGVQSCNDEEDGDEEDDEDTYDEDEDEKDRYHCCRYPTPRLVRPARAAPGLDVVERLVPLRPLRWQRWLMTYSCLQCGRVGPTAACSYLWQQSTLWRRRKLPMNQSTPCGVFANRGGEDTCRVPERWQLQSVARWR